ncbi:Zn-ribbon domain-containing OB-fold protein [Achromobacter aloeverae]|uniref:DNA-binding protein n=1 Tax=Achromobacter aloeverae TaxID=1750518 RepID=A0A4V1MSK1_9BURK|nr:OB-fold domain-containing protein [Achromobacter aloeverae]RXN92320.1 DNA-binding protein [Achromobacter aloeverae]
MNSQPQAPTNTAPARIHPAPIPSSDTLPFWQAAAEGRFLLRRCEACAQAHWYPRPRCPLCGGQTAWTEGSGHGRVYSFTTVAHADTPFVLAFVTLAEGPAMLTHLVHAPADGWAIGDAVRVTFAATDGSYPLPVFEPATDAQAAGD